MCKRMGIGSLSKYRRGFMVLGFLLFAGGALLRWHSKRQVAALESTGGVHPQSGLSWQSDCSSYACRMLGVRGKSCDLLCAEAAANGPARVPAERIAQACKKHCIAESSDSPDCAPQCLVRESLRSAGGH